MSEPECKEAVGATGQRMLLGGPAEKTLVRKLDLHIIPVVMLLYLLSFLDRVNIGNARLYGLEEDLGMHGNMYQTAVSLLFVTYILCEVPSNLVLKKFTPSRWIAFIATSWGIVATLGGVVQSYGGLIAVRLVLGAVEAGLFPGLAVYLTFFYTKNELAVRIGYLFVSAAMAGGFGGLLAYGIGHMQGVAGLSGWRWIFILEGMPTVFMGIATLWLLPNNPETAYFLTDEDKKLIGIRKACEYGQTAAAQEFSKKDVMKGFTDWKCWAFYFGQFGVDTMLYGFSTFLPTIISQLGKWTIAQTQLLTIPCYFLGGVVYMIIAHLSDRTCRRAPFVLAGCTSSMIGYGILLSRASPGIHYLGCFFVAAGLYVAAGIPLAWLPNNNPRYAKRTTATGLQLTIGNCAGILSSFIYPTVDRPRYVRGHAVTLGMIGFSGLMYATMWFVYDRANRRRDAGLEDWKVPLGMSDDEVADLGDESPRYRFTK
ncbi:uncharacterized protein L3040_006366 [Drepanopeziza brunnea f. sp. 'multigermtubi']|uniref:Major facilitator superfamily transporter n=1 Tax=Marssonina brunnea f. sp. multigermtubi (strain MB_m1) TaxID=1072389 RepID=K1X6D9_MARBU|nr:major facilitator superfamily transporter [Drepanopeziza brunnea f. sp. 'multigermtubi' MB_m1]EKD20641.1 major facilitator superfamily transporter [Drepanopeziza brunnea f. sp. 'multigermtubi' MB_m1]KAJ5038686.1 hypothetical protein L3040_006366 [Drepanopeziza brunnea f. sp. 'multigermtubi']